VQRGQSSHFWKIEGNTDFWRVNNPGTNVSLFCPKSLFSGTYTVAARH
jgi:hypothetical protein